MKPWMITTAKYAQKYAKQYNCTITQALKDEDFPISKEEALTILNYLKEPLEEAEATRWASPEYCKEYENELAREYL